MTRIHIVEVNMKEWGRQQEHLLCYVRHGMEFHLYIADRNYRIHNGYDILKKDPIKWTGNFGLHNFYKTLLDLHSNHPALRAGDQNVQTWRISTSENEQIFSYLRKNGEKEVLVILHLSANEDLNFELRNEIISGVYRNIFSGEISDFTGIKNLNIKAWDYLVYEK